MKFLVKLLLTAALVVLISSLLPGITTDGYMTAVLVALALALLNSIVKPVLIVLTLPVTILTLGFFLLIINVIIINIVDYFITGFTVSGFWWALLFSLLLSLGRTAISKIIDKDD